MNADDALDSRIQRAHDESRLVQHAQPHPDRRAASRRRMVKILTFSVCLWALLETPWEVSPNDGAVQTLALLAATLVLICTGLGAVYGSSLARLAFAFLCASSLIAVGSSLPFEYMVSTRIFGLSFVECLLKASLLLAYVIPQEKRQAGMINRIPPPHINERDDIKCKCNSKEATPS